MLPSFTVLKNILATTIASKAEQGHIVDGLTEELAGLPESYDAYHAFALKVADLPVRADWPYVEPNSLEEILAECDPTRPTGAVGAIDLADSARRVEAGFLGSVCGCVLGKPVEVDPTLAEMRAALEATDDWPLNDYISEATLAKLGRRHGSWPETTRGNISYVAPDDDVNYTVLGMIMLEENGVKLRKENIRDAWLYYLPVSTTFGPERTTLIKAAMSTQAKLNPAEFDEWTRVFNPLEEYCGAVIRADSYGYACPGQPSLAAELAYRDASFTHRRTGIYGTMFVAAAIACAQVMSDRLAIFATALQFVPQRSRFYQIVSDSLNEISQASDWLDGYNRIHRKYKEYTHCRIYQEIGTLINTLRFAENVGHGICLQVMQGNDTDSFGATAGSLLGCYFGPGHLEERWVAPFHDDLRTALACFFDRSLTGVAQRMGKLPAHMAAASAAAVKEEHERDAGTGL